jgi:threonine dehydrogenase-like Zn-dependent dehydrogenase
VSGERARAAVFGGPGQPFELAELPLPDPEPGAALIKVRLANICGSDLHQWRGEGGSPIPEGGRVLGHEMVGEVARLGAGVRTDSLGRSLREGDRVVYPYFYPCRRCPQCTRGQFSLCGHRLDHYREPVGRWPHFNGGFAEYYYLRPGHFVFRVPDQLPDELVAPANCALAQVVHALRQVSFGPGQRLVVQGAGALGLYATAVARVQGAGVIAVVDASASRLQLARRFGADAVISLTECPAAEERIRMARELTGGGADVVLEVAGVPSAVPEGLEMVAPGGAYLDVGLLGPDFTVTFHPARLLRRNARYVGSNHYHPIALAEALELLVRERDRYPFEAIVGRRRPLAEIEDAFAGADWASREAPARVAIDPRMG